MLLHTKRSALLGFVLYLSFGATILKFYYGYEGINVLPNKEFWSNLPFLVQVGISIKCESGISLFYVLWYRMGVSMSVGEVAMA